MFSKTSLTLLVAFVTAVLRLLFKRRTLRFLRGPPSPSFLTGNENEMRYQEQVGDLEFQWAKEYGTAYRIAGCLGEDVLLLTDPRGLQHVMQGAGYRYPRSHVSTHSARLLFGSGNMLSVGDEAHQRQRKALNPAFTAAQIRSYLPIFQAYAAKLARKWTEDLADGSKVIEISKPLASVALDALGEAAFKYQFGSLDNWKGSLATAYDNLFVEVNMNPHKLDLVLKSMWRYIPTNLLSYMALLPTRGYRRSRRFLKVSMDTAKSILLNQVNDDQGGRSSDIFSLLARSATSADPKIRMDDDEIQSQMATFMLAGHETTSSSITWALFELARHPKIQDALREEIIAARASLGQKRRVDFTSADLDELPLLNAVVKETLRFHPIAPQVFRVAGCDDSVPLSSPVQAKDGSMLTEIPIKKGQVLHIDIATYNRLSEVWGENANEWAPARFLNADAGANKTSAVGVYTNLMTFSAGVRACIGWRFAVAEMQAVLAEMIEHFQFSLPSSNPDILRVPAGVMVPMIRGQTDMGVYMPLNVTLVES